MNSNLLLILGVLLGGGATYIAIATLLENIFSNQNNSFGWAQGEAPKKSKSPIIQIFRPIVHRLVLPIISRYQLTSYKNNIKREIQSAGLSKELNESEYVGFQVLLGILLPVTILTLNFLFNLKYPVWLVLVIAIFGYLFPYLYVRGKKIERIASIRIDLPFVVDLLSLAVSAGLTLQDAIGKVVEKMSGGPLAEELDEVLRMIRLGSSRAEALEAFAYRLNMREIDSFVAVVVSADQLGASYAPVLRQQSEQIRQERFIRAEKAGVEASQKIFIPLVMFILPAVLLIVFGPVVLQFVGGGK